MDISVNCSLIVRICCLSLGSGLLFGQKKQFEDVNLGSGNL